jgi:hypothetical protein
MAVEVGVASGLGEVGTGNMHPAQSVWINLGKLPHRGESCWACGDVGLGRFGSGGLEVVYVRGGGEEKAGFFEV